METGDRRRWRQEIEGGWEARDLVRYGSKVIIADRVGGIGIRRSLFPPSF
jgi:hypothetical protein